VGWAIVAIGVVGLISEGRAVPFGPFARWLVGLAVFHDLVLAPLVALVGLVVVRAVPRRARPTVTSFLVVAAIVALFSVPFVARWGVSRSTPSIQPRDYATGLVQVTLVVAAVYLVSAVGAVVVRSGRRRQRSRGLPQDSAHV
jgi:hypothetical protein